MALWKGFQEPKDLPVCRTRTLVYKLMVVAPLALTLAIGVESRTASDPYLPLAYTKDESRAVQSYAGFVIRTASVFKHGTQQTDLAQVETLARDWMRAFEEGDLKPLAPAFYEDSPNEGAKGQIMVAAARVQAGLNAHARRLMESGQSPKEALEVATLALRLAEKFKGYDMSSFVKFTLHQRRSLDLLSEIATSLSSTERAAALNLVSNLNFSREYVARLAGRDRLHYASYMLRQGVQVQSIEGKPGLMSLASLQGNNPKASLNPTLACMNDELASVVYMADGAHAESQKVFNKTIAALSK